MIFVMKLRKGFVLRDICGERVLSAESDKTINFTSLVRLNETSAYLWESLQDVDFTVSDMVDLLCKRYDVTPEVAQKDCEALASKFAEIGLVEE